MKQKNKSILFVGQAFYNAWYLSRELRKLGWKADLINIDSNPANENYYHGEDIKFAYKSFDDLKFRLNTFINAIVSYSVFQFANKGGIYFVNHQQSPGRILKLLPLIDKLIVFITSGYSVDRCVKLLKKLRMIKVDSSEQLQLTNFGFWSYQKFISKWLFYKFGDMWDIHIAKQAGIKIGYANNGCLDGALQTSFAKWGPLNTCQICAWYNNDQVCSDHLNAEWGKFRNNVADYQCTIGSNKVDFNDVPEVFESPWFYCLDTQVWNPDMLIPSNYLLPFSKETVKIYHAVGNFESRSTVSNKNIKCTHIYLPLIEKFKSEGLPVELIFFHGLPNKVVRYYQAQADIVVDMLTFGFFGANIREAMMLGIPTVCYLRPEWLEEMRKEIPDYVDELPVVSATPDTVEEILRDLINDKEKRDEIGRKSREFAVKWHGSEIAARYFDRFLSLHLEGNANKQTVFEIQKTLYN